MNKRQAKIEALWLAVGVLAGVDSIAIDLPVKNQEKVEAEFQKITNRLRTRVMRLEANL